VALTGGHIDGLGLTDLDALDDGLAGAPA